MEEIMERIDKELAAAGRSGMLPAGVVFTGGGSKLPGTIEAAKNHLRLPASLGYPLDITSVTDKVNDLAFTTAIGLVRWGINASTGGDTALGKFISRFTTMNQVSDNMKKWLRSLLP